MKYDKELKHLSGIMIFGLLPVLFISCSGKADAYDASGSFEAVETIISAEATGTIESFKVEEGQILEGGAVVGYIDSTQLALRKKQLEAQVKAMGSRLPDIAMQTGYYKQQLAAAQIRLDNLKREQTRIGNLVKADAATPKQLDDINYQINAAKKEMAVIQQQINVQKNNVATQNRSILSEADPLRKRIAQLQDQAQRANIVNPVNGTVIAKYAEAGEVTSAGKALYKIADLSELNLRAYVTGVQLPTIKLGQQVKVLIDQGEKSYKEYQGTITWISDKAEFTPKTIQTKEERANLVYAIKVKVKNDGYLKIGMYGEVKL